MREVEKRKNVHTVGRETAKGEEAIAGDDMISVLVVEKVKKGIYSTMLDELGTAILCMVSMNGGQKNKGLGEGNGKSRR